MRVYAIGDIHGRLDLLDELHGLILADSERSQPIVKAVVYLGDYVDRGLQSKEVVDRLLEGPLPGFRPYYLKGNHEQALLDFLEDVSVGPAWRNFGGCETMHSYGVAMAGTLATRHEFEAAQADFAARLPASHLAFFRALKLSVTLGDYHFVHAGVRPGVPLERQVPEDLLWIRDVFLDSDEDFGKTVVHGHTPEPQPVIRHNRIGIDTGAYMTGILTCLVLEKGERRFLQTGQRPALDR
jgi:serine/threonine protein phosphatase 1